MRHEHDDWTLRTAEWVLPGHPDKLSDAIADSIVQAAWRKDPRALVGIEVALVRKSVFLTGRIAGANTEQLCVESLVHNVFASAGYSEKSALRVSDLHVVTDLCRGPLEGNESELRASSDDQSIVTGYACSSPGTSCLPVEHALARHLAKALHAFVRTDSSSFGQDGKVIVFVRESPDARRWELDALSVSVEQLGEACSTGGAYQLRVAMQRALDVFAQRVPGFSHAPSVPMHVNGNGWTGVGGPMSDNGLSGKKLVVDFYGPRVPIGGGAMSGKDFWKVDRAGPLIARELAVKAIERHGCREAFVTLGICPGETLFRVVRIEAENRIRLDARQLAASVDLRLASRARWLEGKDLVEVARWGHWTEESKLKEYDGDRTTMRQLSTSPVAM